MSNQRDTLPDPLPAHDALVPRTPARLSHTSRAAARPRSPRRHLFSGLASGCLLILLLAQFIGSWPFAASVAFASGKPKAVPGHLTLQQFLREGAGRRASVGSFSFSSKPPQVTLAKGEHLANYAHLPPSAQPPTMKPLTVTLSAAFLAGNAPPLDLTGSDHHLEVRLAPGSLDLSHASVAGTASGSTISRTRQPVTATPTPTATGATASPTHTPTATAPPSVTPSPTLSGPLLLTITQVQGIFVGQVSLFAQYRFQITAVHGKFVSGITLRQPMTLIYHYDPAVLASLGFDPGALYATWPALSNAARAAHQPTDPYIMLLHNDATSHTLTGQSRVLVNGLLDDGNGNPANQAPPTPLVAAMAGNSGQLSYSYPLTVAPGPLGTMPNLNLVYSSQATNERTSQTAPANDFGEGWSLSLGSISADEYPAGSAGGQATWYSISGVDNISDLLVPNPKDSTQFLTEHISYLRIRQTSANGQPCFDVWDTGGTEYIFGCTADSLQYYTTSDGTRHNYRWDLDDVIPANEGPNTDTRFIQISYLQDKASTNGYPSIRDAVMKQITYGIQGFLSGTIDFSYQAPFSDPPWTTAYGGSCAPLRCDDPTNYSGGLDAPLVMTTFTPVSVTSYVGTDGSSSNKDYSYAFSYGGTGEQACTDDYSGLSEYCAGEHLLQSVTPTVYQNGSGTRLPELSVAYNGGSKDDYTDTTQTVPGGGNYSVKTFWDYLAFYDDLATGVGATITYQTAYNNSDGTPETSPSENRYDALYCSKYFCSGNYDHPSDRAWSAQVVTSLTTLGADSSALAVATTSYNYRLAKTGTYQGPPSQLCYPAGSDNDCVGDTWQPAGDGDWLDFYHSEFRGFAEVDILSPAGELTVQTYASTDGWGQPESNAHDYTAGALNVEKIYQGASPSTPLLQETQNIYAGYKTLDGTQTDNSCNGSYSGVYPPCEVFLITSRTTEYDGTNSSSAPWVEQDFTYDDYSPPTAG